MKIEFQSVIVLVVSLVLIIGAMVLAALETITWDQAWLAIVGGVSLALPGAVRFGQTEKKR